jgi:hypothetical protein
VPTCVDAIQIFWAVEGYEEDLRGREGDERVVNRWGWGVERWGWGRHLELEAGCLEDEDGAGSAREDVACKCWVGESSRHAIWRLWIFRH